MSEHSFLSVSEVYTELATKCTVISTLVSQLTSAQQTNQILETSTETLKEEVQVQQDLISYKDSLISTLNFEIERQELKNLDSSTNFNTVLIDQDTLQDSLEVLSNSSELNQNSFMKIKDLFIYLLEFKALNEHS